MAALSSMSFNRSFSYSDFSRFGSLKVPAAAAADGKEDRDFLPVVNRPRLKTPIFLTRLSGRQSPSPHTRLFQPLRFLPSQRSGVFLFTHKFLFCNLNVIFVGNVKHMGHVPLVLNFLRRWCLTAYRDQHKASSLSPPPRSPKTHVKFKTRCWLKS